MLSILQYNPIYESKVFIPNEIIKDLQANMNKSLHIPFAYTYYYLITWLYQYAKYGYIQIDNAKIKGLLGYHPTYPDVNYIIKKNGLLDQMGYTVTKRDYPIHKQYNGEEVEFTLLSDLDSEIQKEIAKSISRKFTIKFPVKCFHRYIEDEEWQQDYKEGYVDGTFYDISNTFHVPFDVFVFCMNNKKLGNTAFYLWSFLKYKNQQHQGGYDVSIERLIDETKIRRTTLLVYLDLLKSHNMIECILNQEYFTVLLNKDDRKPNTHIANDFTEFSTKIIKYQKLDRSSGENKIRKYLNENNFDFISQYRFSDCKDSVTLPFDFAVFHNEELYLLIEFDGHHHYHSIEYFGGDEYLENVKRKDEIKNSYCIDNCIRLLRIPYWDIENLKVILENELSGINSTNGGNK